MLKNANIVTASGKRYTAAVKTLNIQIARHAKVQEKATAPFVTAYFICKESVTNVKAKGIFNLR